MTDFPNSIAPAPAHKTVTRGLLGGLGRTHPPAGLLGPYYDPAEKRRQMLSRGLLGAGIELLTNGKGSFGEVLGQGLAGGLAGAQQGGQDYLQDAYSYQQLAQQQADRQRQIENDTFTRNRQMKQDAWTNTQNQRTLEEQQRADEERQAKRASIMEWMDNKTKAMDPQQAEAFTNWARDFPEEAAKLYSSEMMPGEADGVEYGLNPIWGTGPSGTEVYQLPKVGGKPLRVEFPEGFKPEPGVQYLDTGLGYLPANKRTGLPEPGATPIPKNVFEEAATREGGKQSEAVPAQAVQEYLKPNGIKEQDDATLNSIASIHEARKMLEKGIQTGALADKLQSLRSIGDALGFEVDDRVLTDTQTYQNFIRQTVIPKMKELGGNDSNEELRKMELLSGADIKQQDQTLRNTLDLTEKLLAKKFKSRELYRRATKKYFGDAYEIPELPTYNTTPQGGGKVIDGYTIRRVQ